MYTRHMVLLSAIPPCTPSPFPEALVLCSCLLSIFSNGYSTPSPWAKQMKNNWTTEWKLWCHCDHDDSIHLVGQHHHHDGASLPPCLANSPPSDLCLFLLFFQATIQWMLQILLLLIPTPQCNALLWLSSESSSCLNKYWYKKSTATTSQSST